jgi:hypothetical protein
MPGSPDRCVFSEQRVQPPVHCCALSRSLRSLGGAALRIRYWYGISTAFCTLDPLRVGSAAGPDHARTAGKHPGPQITACPRGPLFPAGAIRGTEPHPGSDEQGSRTLLWDKGLCPPGLAGRTPEQFGFHRGVPVLLGGPGATGHDCTIRASATFIGAIRVLVVTASRTCKRTGRRGRLDQVRRESGYVCKLFSHQEHTAQPENPHCPAYVSEQV